MKEILNAGGVGYLMPAVLFAVVFYLSRGLFGWHGRRSQHRKDFLELWDATRSQDDVWLEAVVRHWLGTHLPTHVIRLAMAQPDKSQSLIELSGLWPLLRYDRNARTVSWLDRRHNTHAKRKAKRVLFIAGYFLGMSVSLAAAYVASQYGPNTLYGWVYGVFGVLTLFLALICILEDDVIKAADLVGDAWIDRINRSASPSGTRSRDDDRDKGAGSR